MSEKRERERASEQSERKRERVERNALTKTHTHTDKRKRARLYIYSEYILLIYILKQEEERGSKPVCVAECVHKVEQFNKGDFARKSICDFFPFPLNFCFTFTESSA